MHNSIDVGASPTTSVVANQKVVMLVDDDPIFRRLTSGFLESQGYRVIEAENGTPMAYNSYEQRSPMLFYVTYPCRFWTG